MDGGGAKPRMNHIEPSHVSLEMPNFERAYRAFQTQAQTIETCLR